MALGTPVFSRGVFVKKKELRDPSGKDEFKVYLS